MNDTPNPSRDSDSTAEWSTATPLLRKWLERSRSNQMQHYLAASHYDRAHNLLGVPTVVLAAIVGSAVFASLQKQVGLKVQITVGAISVLAAVLAALQTFLRYSERAEKHRSAATEYASVRKTIEAIGYIPVEQRGHVQAFISTIQSKVDTLAKSAPDPPQRIWLAMRSRESDNYFIPDWMKTPAPLGLSTATTISDPAPRPAPPGDPYQWS